MNIHHSVNEYQPCKFIVPFITPIRINYDFPAVLKRLAPSLRRRSFVSFPLARTRLEFRYEFPSLSLSPVSLHRYKAYKERMQRMYVVPRYDPVYVEPNLKEYETQVLQMSVPVDDNDSYNDLQLDFSNKNHAFSLDNVSYITKDHGESTGNWKKIFTNMIRYLYNFTYIYYYYYLYILSFGYEYLNIQRLFSFSRFARR